MRIFTHRYRYKNTTEYSIRDELEKKGIETRPLEEITLEKEYEKLEKVHWDNSTLYINKTLMSQVF